MKVAFISTASNMSGATLALLEIIDALNKKGIEIIVITASRGELEKKLKKRKIKYYKALFFSWLIYEGELDSFKGKVKWGIKKILEKYSENLIFRILKKEKIDILHINTGISPVGIKSAKKCQVPIVWHIRENASTMFGRVPFSEEYELECLNMVDIVITISKYVASLYINKCSKNLYVIYDGVDTSDCILLRDKPIFSENIVKISMCGYNEFKGHKDAITAAKYLKELGYKNFEINFWGDIEVQYKSELEELIKKNNLDKYVFFKGYTSTMKQKWAESDIALMCSNGECFGRSTVEAMATGALVIGSNTGATPEIIQEKYGLIYDKTRPESLAEAIEYALNHKEEVRKIADKAQKFIEGGAFSLKKNIEQIINIYLMIKKGQ